MLIAEKKSIEEKLTYLLQQDNSSKKEADVQRGICFQLTTQPTPKDHLHHPFHPLPIRCCPFKQCTASMVVPADRCRSSTSSANNPPQFQSGIGKKIGFLSFRGRMPFAFRRTWEHWNRQ
jgi:hypothetical protein